LTILREFSPIYESEFHGGEISGSDREDDVLAYEAKFCGSAVHGCLQTAQKSLRLGGKIFGQLRVIVSPSESATLQLLKRGDFGSVDEIADFDPTAFDVDPRIVVNRKISHRVSKDSYGRGQEQT
jgi:hypothetical protein